MPKLEQFFGIDLSKKDYDLDEFIRIVGLEKEVQQHATTKSLAQELGEGHRMVQISKRQYALKLLRPLFSNKCLAYDAHFYKKDCNTSSERDRRYGAEEKLLQFGLIIAAGRSLHQIQAEGFKPDVKYLREQSASGDLLAERLEKLMAENTREDILAYKSKQNSAKAKGAKGSKSSAKGSFWKRLFS